MARLSSSVWPTLKRRIAGLLMDQSVAFRRWRNRTPPSRLIVLIVSVIFFLYITSRLAGNDNDAEIDADSMTARQVTDYFLMTNRSSCRLVHDFGGKMERNQNHFTQSGIDGQKAVCLDPSQVAPPSLAANNKCIVYSFGINNEWSFDCAMVEYGCQVFAFDPSMRNQSGPVEGITFFPIGLGHRDEKVTSSDWQLYTLRSIHQMMRTQHGVGAVIDYLKIDIEHSEWLVLPQIFESGMLNLVRQLAVEIHIKSDSTLDDQRHYAGILQQLERHGGMVRFDSKYNLWSRAYFTELDAWAFMAYEIAWYNSRFL